MHRASLGLMLLFGCSDNFAPASDLTGIRILGTQSSAPFAAPGERVTLRTLAVDARKLKTQSMNVFYIPEPCVDPQAEDPSACYAAFDARFSRGADVTGALVPGDTLSLTAPAIAEGTFGTLFTFVMACAGSVRYLGPNRAFPKAPPFGCFDSGGRAVGADDFVFAYARTYVTSAIRNANPVIDALVSGQEALSQDAPLRVARCDAEDRNSCPETKVDVRIADTAQEVDVITSTPSDVRKEEITVSYFTTGGRMSSNAVLVLDSVAGRVTKTETGFRAPSEAGDYTLYAVVRDGRAGLSWHSVPIQVR